MFPDFRCENIWDLVKNLSNPAAHVFFFRGNVDEGLERLTQIMLKKKFEIIIPEIQTIDAAATTADTTGAAKVDEGTKKIPEAEESKVSPVKAVAAEA